MSGGHNSITKKYFYHTDNLGSTVAITDDQGQTVWSGDYTPFGKVASQNGMLENVKQFTGKDLDEDTGLYYYNARWYDSETGRFISEAPAQDQDNPNLYTYCGNNPVFRIDPTGLDWLDDLIDKALVYLGIEKNKTTNDNNDKSSTSNNIQLTKEEIQDLAKTDPYAAYLASLSPDERQAVLSSTYFCIDTEVREFCTAYSIAMSDMLRSAAAAERLIEVLETNSENSSTTIKGVTFEGSIYRSVSGDSDPLEIHEGNINANYRYSAKGIGALYFSTNENTVNAELNQWGVSTEGRVLYSYNVKLTNMLDLPNPNVRKQLGVTLQDITGNSYKITQQIGQYAQKNGYNGIITPSARADGGLNVVIFDNSTIKNQ